MHIIKKHLTVREYFQPDSPRRERIGIRLLNFQHVVYAYPQHFLEQTYFHYMPLIKLVMYIRPHPDIAPRNVRPMLPKRYKVSKTIFVVEGEMGTTS